MDIDKFAGAHCDFCDSEQSKPCLSCMKIIIYEAIREGVLEGFKDCCVDEIDVAIKKGVALALACDSSMAIEEGTRRALEEPRRALKNENI